MQKITIRFALLFSLFFVFYIKSSFASDVDQGKLDKIDEVLYGIKEVAEIYPPSINLDSEKKKILSSWKDVETELNSMLNQHPDDYKLLLRLGECYRFGNNLDIEGANEKAIFFLKKAIFSKPEKSLPHILLGYHFAFSANPSEALKEYLIALDMEHDEHFLLYIYFGIAHAYYFQKDFSNAKLYSSKYLLVDNSNNRMKLINEKSDASLRGEFDLPTIKVKLPSKASQ